MLGAALRCVAELIVLFELIVERCLDLVPACVLARSFVRSTGDRPLGSRLTMCHDTHDSFTSIANLIFCRTSLP